MRDVERREVAHGPGGYRLHDVPGVEHAARGAGQPAMRPAAEPRQQSGEQRVQRVLLAVAKPLQQLQRLLWRGRWQQLITRGRGCVVHGFDGLSDDSSTDTVTLLLGENAWPHESVHI